MKMMFSNNKKKIPRTNPQPNIQQIDKINTNIVPNIQYDMFSRILTASTKCGACGK
jgi:hypothetical protein